MQFTLDSVEQFRESLEATTKIKYTFKPALYHDLKEVPDFSGEQADYYHFGVLTLGASYRNHESTFTKHPISSCSLYGNSSFPHINIEPNSQIVSFFKIIVPRDVDGRSLPFDPVKHIEGSFRGFILYPIREK